MDLQLSASAVRRALAAAVESPGHKLHGAGNGWDGNLREELRQVSQQGWHGPITHGQETGREKPESEQVDRHSNHSTDQGGNIGSGPDNKNAGVQGQTHPGRDRIPGRSGKRIQGINSWKPGGGDRRQCNSPRGGALILRRHNLAHLLSQQLCYSLRIFGLNRFGSVSFGQHCPEADTPRQVTWPKERRYERVESESVLHEGCSAQTR